MTQNKYPAQMNITALADELRRYDRLTAEIERQCARLGWLGRAALWLRALKPRGAEKRARAIVDLADTIKAAERDLAAPDRGPG